MAKSNSLPPSLEEANRLLAAVEHELVRQTRRARTLTADALDAVATRSKRLRRRFHDLADSPASRTGGRSSSVAATADLFDAVLHRVENLLSGGADFIAPAKDRSKAASKTSKKAARKSSKKAAKKSSKKPSSGSSRKASKKTAGKPAASAATARPRRTAGAGKATARKSTAGRVAARRGRSA